MEKRDTGQLLVRIIRDVRFWIGLFAVVHTLFITLPPLEPGSTWRQSDGLMIARNFYERNPNIFYPTTDVCGDRSGITGCEFPLINYSIALLSHVFGYHDWFGRLLNVLLSSIGLFYFYRLVRDQFGTAMAFNATLIILASAWFTYNRTNIPDTFAVSLCMIGIYHAVKYLHNGKTGSFVMFFVPALAACLIRISAASLLTVLVIPFFTNATPRTRAVFGVGSSVILAAVYCWYFVWVPYLNETFGISTQFFMGMSFSDGIKLLLSDLPLTLKRFYDTPLKYSGFIVFAGSFILAILKKQRILLLVFLIPFLSYSVMVMKLAVGWHIDAYYVLMYVPVMALVAGWGLTQIRGKTMAMILLAGVMIEGVGNQFHVLRIREPNLSLTKLELIMDGLSTRNDLIATNGIHTGDPTPLYMAHRRGWSLEKFEFYNPGMLSHLQEKGCKFVVILRRAIDEVSLDLPVVFQSDDFTVYQLK